ncbi:MAG: aminopeptidase [Burkholderiaceae bacterium]|nr:aminopeptidase [Burkholderiaceae bacterium]
MASGSVLATAVFAVAAVCLGSGCSTLGYYAQAAGGHLDVMKRSRPVVDWLQDGSTAAPLRQRLQLSQRLRDFAVSELKLPDNASYRRYADLQRSAVVWNVVAAPELSLTLKTWCFPVVGCVGYRGYFGRDGADALAAQLRGDGWEVSVYGVHAYSTLGWTNWIGGDPLLNTFIHWPEGELARMVFHELAHQVAYADDDTTFNESFATAVERIGGARWLERHGSPQARAEYAALDARRQDFRALVFKTREELEAVYASVLLDATRRERKAAVLAAMRVEYAALKAGRWGGFAGYDGWFERANNAAFGVQAAYHELVPAFERVFESSGGDFPRFYAEVQRLAALPKDQRRAKLVTPP